MSLAMKMLAIVALKGGVGKTTVTVGIARAMHRAGYKVGISDLDYRSPCVPLVLGENRKTLKHGPGDSLVPPLVQGMPIFSMAFIWPPDRCVAVEDELAVQDVGQLLEPGVIAWPEDLDFLVIDSPPSSSGIMRVILKAQNLGGAVLVTVPSTLARAALVRTIDLCAETRVPIYGIICNQAYDETSGLPLYDISPGDIERLGAQRGLPFYAPIPHSVALEQQFDRVVPGLLATHPVVLEKPITPETRWKQVMQEIRQF